MIVKLIFATQTHYKLSFIELEIQVNSASILIYTQ